MSQLHLRRVTLRIADRILLQNVDLQLMEGEHVGLVGPNGCGKSTLFKTLLGEQEPDGGDLLWGRGIRVGAVAQEPPAGEKSPLQVVLEADQEREVLLAVAELSEDPVKRAEAHQRLLQIQSDAAPARAAQLLAGLGFSSEAQKQPCRELSGGWRGRVALAAALFAQPDVLLLDEPTNHLDLEATLWLISFLQRYSGTLFIISHDRALLNAVPSRIIHVDECKLVSYRGGFDDFLKQRSERAQRAEALQTKQTAQRVRLQSFVDRFRAKASKARQAQSRMKALEKLPPIAALSTTEAFSFDFPDPDPICSPLIEIKDGIAGYANTAILKKLNLAIQGDDRIALLGANGNGKTTLLRVLSGRMALLGGESERRPKLRVGYFSQHQTEEMPNSSTAVQLVIEYMPKWIEEQARGFLGRFGFGAGRVETPIGQLSGGEKARLLLALISLKRPHLLILDEPTNHLDMDSVDALVEALNDYQGAIVLVTHDPSLIERCADTLWFVGEGTCRLFPGDLEEYRSECLRQKTERNPTVERSAPKKTQERRQAAQMRIALAPLKACVAATEKHVHKLAAEKVQLEHTLGDPQIYSRGNAYLLEVQQKLLGVSRELVKAEALWLDAVVDYEKAEQELSEGE